MARLRYNGLTAELAADLAPASTTITFTAALTSAAGAVPTITGTDYIPLAVLDTDGSVLEIIHLTAYTSGATTGTVARAQESTTAADRASGLTLVHGPTVDDFSTTTSGAASAAVAWRSTAQSIPNATNTAITFDTASVDTDGYYSGATPTRITIPAGLAGQFIIVGAVRYSANSTGTRGVNLRTNGTTFILANSLPANGTTGYTGTTIAQLAAGDYIELVAYQSSGGSLNTDAPAGIISTSLSIARLGD